MKKFSIFYEEFNEPHMLNLMRKAFDAKADSPEQKKLIGQLNAYRVKYGMDPVPMGEEAKYDYGTTASVKYMKKKTPGEVDEKVLDKLQRRKIGLRMKRLAKKTAIARKRALNKRASNEKLEKRARKAAKNVLRKKLAGKMGANYASLSATEKIMVDKRVEKAAPAIGKIMKKLLPSVKKAEGERLKKRRESK